MPPNSGREDLKVPGRKSFFFFFFSIKFLSHEAGSTREQEQCRFPAEVWGQVAAGTERQAPAWELAPESWSQAQRAGPVEASSIRLAEGPWLPYGWPRKPSASAHVRGRPYLHPPTCPLGAVMQEAGCQEVSHERDATSTYSQI